MGCTPQVLQVCGRSKLPPPTRPPSIHPPSQHLSLPPPSPEDPTDEPIGPAGHPMRLESQLPGLGKDSPPRRPPLLSHLYYLPSPPSQAKRPRPRTSERFGPVALPPASPPSARSLRSVEAARPPTLMSPTEARPVALVPTHMGGTLRLQARFVAGSTAGGGP